MSAVDQVRGVQMFFHKRVRGFTIIEMLATIVIMSVLAVLVAPMGTVLFFQGKELMLRENLREIRRAIDKYYDMNKRVFTNAPADGMQNCYPFTWQDLYEGYLRKTHALNPITYKYEDYDVQLDKKGIFLSQDWPGTYINIDDFPYPESDGSAEAKTIYEKDIYVGAPDDYSTVLLDPEEFQLRELDMNGKVDTGLYTPPSVWWTDAGMFDVKYPSKGKKDKMLSLDGNSFYHEW
jgi:prepilin-type N-terminal cleavage/methylation domain-containing protein